MALSYRQAVEVPHSSGGIIGRFPGDQHSTTKSAYDVPLAQPDEFTEFELYTIPGWDGFDAEPITPETIRAARRFKSLLPHRVRPADVAPGADGTIGFEWRSGVPSNRTTIFIEVGPSDLIRGYISRPGTLQKWPVRPLGVGAYNLIEALFPTGNEYF